MVPLGFDGHPLGFDLALDLRLSLLQIRDDARNLRRAIRIPITTIDR